MVQKISKERLERSLAKDENLSKLTNTTKNWLRENIVKDNDIKATNKTEKAADKLINTKSKGVVNWVKNNPVEAGLLLIPGAVGVRLAQKAGSFILKKYGPKAAKKVKEVIKDKGKTKDLLQLEYKKKSSPTGNINKAKPPSTIFQGSGQKRIGFNKPNESVITKTKLKNNKTDKPTGTKTKVVKTETKTKNNKTDKSKDNKTTTKTKTDKTYNVIDPKTGRITDAAKKAENKRRMEIIKRQRAESKKRKEDKEKADKPKVVKTTTKPKTTKTVATTKNTNFIINDTLSKSFKQNPAKVRDQIMNSNMGRAEKIHYLVHYKE